MEEEIKIDSFVGITMNGKRVEVDAYEAGAIIHDLFTRFPGAENRPDWYDGVRQYMLDKGFEGRISDAGCINFLKIIQKAEDAIEKKLSAAFPNEQA